MSGRGGGSGGTGGTGRTGGRVGRVAASRAEGAGRLASSGAAGHNRPHAWGQERPGRGARQHRAGLLWGGSAAARGGPPTRRQRARLKDPPPPLRVRGFPPPLQTPPATRDCSYIPDRHRHQPPPLQTCRRRTNVRAVPEASQAEHGQRCRRRGGSRDAGEKEAANGERRLFFCPPRPTRDKQCKGAYPAWPGGPPLLCTARRGGAGVQRCGRSAATPLPNGRAWTRGPVRAAHGAPAPPSDWHRQRRRRGERDPPPAA